MRNPPIHIIVDRSRVTLTGLVRSEVDRRLAQALATQFNALSVTNELRTDAEMRGRRDPAIELPVRVNRDATVTALRLRSGRAAAGCHARSSRTAPAPASTAPS